MSRSTKAELAALDVALTGLIRAAGPPVTLRQVYYLAVSAGLVSKDHSGTKLVERRLGVMREDGRLPWSWIVDNTRRVDQPYMYRDADEAIEELLDTYRRDPWQDQDTRVEVWVESDSIASFIRPMTHQYGVPMLACRGQSSKTFINTAAGVATKVDKPVRAIYLGDHDPTGLQIERSLVERYRRYGVTDLEVERIAVTPAQIRALGLVGGPVKTGDVNYGRFEAACVAAGIPVLAVETEALPPPELRRLVQEALFSRIDYSAWKASAAAEDADKARLRALLDR